MLYVIIIGLVCAFIQIAFIVWELNMAFNSYNYYMSKVKGLGYLTWPKIVIKSWMPVIKDIILTLGLTIVFSLRGNMLAMIISLMFSGVLSIFLFIRHQRKPRRY